jgi:LDH2 family malate/lactate/ureidoglycolate dehydrogenase
MWGTLAAATHALLSSSMRGLSVAQKVIVLQCYQRKQSGAKAIIAEFEETARRRRAINGAVVATPKEESITSFIAYHKKKERDGIPVGQTTLEDLQNFANSKAYGKI